MTWVKSFFWASFNIFGHIITSHSQTQVIHEKKNWIALEFKYPENSTKQQHIQLPTQYRNALLKIR